MIGKRVVKKTIGICNFGSFRILLGNDVTSEFMITIDLSNRKHCSYVHPELGVQTIPILEN